MHHQRIICGVAFPPKAGKNSKYKCSNAQKQKPCGPLFWSFEFGSLDIVSSFVLRILNFELLCK